MRAITTVVLAVLAGSALCASASASQVYVSIAAGEAILAVKPRGIHLVSNENLYRLRWRSWGGRTARGQGLDRGNFPAPGHKATNPVRVELRDRRSCRVRLRSRSIVRLLIYTTVRVRFTRGAPYRTPSLITWRYGCPQV